MQERKLFATSSNACVPENIWEHGISAMWKFALRVGSVRWCAFSYLYAWISKIVIYCLGLNSALFQLTIKKDCKIVGQLCYQWIRYDYQVEVLQPIRLDKRISKDLQFYEMLTNKKRRSNTWEPATVSILLSTIHGGRKILWEKQLLRQKRTTWKLKLLVFKFLRLGWVVVLENS